MGFSDEDLSLLGKSYNQALHITVESKSMTIPYVLIDNGSTINVCPLKTAISVGIDITSLEDSLLTVRGYDNTKRDVLGSVILDLRIGPAMFIQNFK